MTKISIETDLYNERRYGKPWIAVVTFEYPSTPTFKFGEWIGSIGCSGILEIDVEEGDVIARGQKDNRKPLNSTPAYYIFENGKMQENSILKKDAYLHFKKMQENSVSELDRLKSRRNEIYVELTDIDLKIAQITEI